MVRLEKFDWDKGPVQYRANERAVEKFCNFFLNSQAWHDDIELVHKKVREFRKVAEYVKPEEPREGAQARS